MGPGSAWFFVAALFAGTGEPDGPRACRNDDCTYLSVERALADAADGDTLRILPGTYRDGGVLKASHVRIAGEGAHLRGAAFQDKAALVIQGDDVVIEGLECSEIRVPDRNGGCVRAEGRDLTLRGVHFHDAQTGLLSGATGGAIVIEDSVIERMGRALDEDGNPHGLYIGHADTFVLRRSRVVGSVGEGHEVKSRAARTVIEDNVIASLDGNDSRLIDVPNGGDVTIRGNVLEKGPASSNDDLIGIGLERGRRPELDHVVNRALVEGNTMIIDRRGRAVLVRTRDVTESAIRDNVVVGGSGPWRGGVRWVRDRDAAGFAPYPFLPEIDERPR